MTMDDSAADAREPGLWRTFGPLAPYLLRPGVTDLFVTGTGDLWSDGPPDGLRREEGWRADRSAARELAIRLIAAGGRHIDEATPFVDVRLRGGVRVHAVLAPVSTGGALLSIRIPSRQQPRLDDLVAGGGMRPSDRDRLVTAVRARTNVLITGAGGAGKTTLLAAMLGAAPPDERIVVIEDVAELRIPHPHVVSLETRQPNLEGAGGVDLRRLVFTQVHGKPSVERRLLLNHAPP